MASTSISTRNIIRKQWAINLQLPTTHNGLNNPNYFQDVENPTLYVVACYIYATQYGRIAHALQRWLALEQAIEPLTHVEAHQYALFQAIRLLRHFHHVSQPVLGPTFQRCFCPTALLNHLKAQLRNIFKEVTSLEQRLHRSLIPQTHGPYHTIALESLLELSIQCILDFLQDRFPGTSFDFVYREVKHTFYCPSLDPCTIYNDLASSIHDPLLQTQSQIPEKGPRFGLPMAIFLALYDNTVHIGGSQMKFALKIPGHRKFPYSVDGIVYTAYRATRREVLSILDGVSTLVSIGSDSQQYSLEVSRINPISKLSSISMKATQQAVELKANPMLGLVFALLALAQNAGSFISSTALG